jgi:GPH family glycoside/pentoside/hexuronide:cation symporter
MFPVAAMAVPVFVYLGKFYADVVLLPLGTLALAIALARAFDALTDPLVGWLSDATRSRWGRRRPYLALGAPLLGASFLGLFAPPESLSTAGATWWFGVAFLAYFVCQTIFIVPYNALGPELTLDYHERSSLFGWREAAFLGGTILAAVAPGVLVGWLGSQRGAYALMGLLYAVVLSAFGFAAAARLRERAEFAARPSNPFVPGVRRALRNRPFRILLTSYVVGSVTAAIPATLLPFFIEYVIRPERVVFWTTLGIASHFVAALVAIPGFVFASRRLGKRPAWLASYAMSILSLGGVFFLGPGDVGPGLALFAWAGLAFGGQLLLTPSIQADVIDYDELHTGRRREAQYGALWALFPKLVAIPGAAVPLAVLGAIGYQPNAEQSEEVVFAIRALLGLVPAAFATLALVVAWRFPITETIHRDIQRGIERHARGEAVHDPLTGELLPPPGRRGVDDATGWLLDHFSRGELARAAERGVGRLRTDAALAAGFAAVACAAAVALALLRLRVEPGQAGAVAVVAIAAAGASFAVFVFHALRLRAARGIDPARVPPAVLEAHLAALAGSPPR